MISATPADHRLASEAAASAGRLLIELRIALLDPDCDAQALRRRADRESHELIFGLLRARRPHDAVLSEEAPDEDSRLIARRVWIVDPLDGTREFAEQGRTDWAVHVALVIDGRPVAGAICLPAVNRVFSSGRRPDPMRPPASPARLVVSRSRPPTVAWRLAEALELKVTSMGSAGAKAATVFTGAAEIYLHAGGQYEWDSAAPVAVATAHGYHSSDLDGIELHYNRESPWQPELLICHPAVKARVLRALKVAQLADIRPAS